MSLKFTNLRLVKSLRGQWIKHPSSRFFHGHSLDSDIMITRQCFLISCPFCGDIDPYFTLKDELWISFMMTSSNGNIFRVTGHLGGNSLVTGEFPAQRPVTWSFDVFLDLHLKKQLSKQSWGWWFEKPSRPLWCHYNISKVISRELTMLLCNQSVSITGLRYEWKEQQEFLHQ